MIKTNLEKDTKTGQHESQINIEILFLLTLSTCGKLHVNLKGTTRVKIGKKGDFVMYNSKKKRRLLCRKFKKGDQLFSVFF